MPAFLASDLESSLAKLNSGLNKVNEEWLKNDELHENVHSQIRNSALQRTETYKTITTFTEMLEQWHTRLSAANENLETLQLDLGILIANI